MTQSNYWQGYANGIADGSKLTLTAVCFGIRISDYKLTEEKPKKSISNKEYLDEIHG